MTIKGMLFDFDGTLGDTIPVCIAGMRRVILHYLNCHYSDEQIMAMFGPSEEGMIQRLVALNRWEEATAVFIEEYRRVHDQCRQPFAGIEEVLGLLKSQGVALAIVTGKGPQSARVSLEHLQLSHYFDVIDTGSPEGAIKPRQIARVLGRWQMSPHEAAYVGDAPSDVDAARQAGVLPLAAAWATSANPQQLKDKNPHALFESIHEFATWIKAQMLG